MCARLFNVAHTETKPNVQNITRYWCTHALLHIVARNCGTIKVCGHCIGVSLVHLGETLGLGTPKKCYNMVYLNTSTCTLNRHTWYETYVSESCIREIRARARMYAIHNIHSHRLWVPCWKKEYLKFDCRFPGSRSFLSLTLPSQQPFRLNF